MLKSEEAYNNKDNQEIVYMKSVKAVFYFKDDTILNVSSNTGTYNNKTLDMNFDGDVVATYEGSQLFAEKAEYSNSESFLKISNKVKIIYEMVGFAHHKCHLGCGIRNYSIL